MHCTLRRQHFGRIILGKNPCDQVLHFWYHQVIHHQSESLRVCASDWIIDPPVHWINYWNRLSTFSRWDFVEMEYPVRDVATFRSPPTILRRPSDLFISAWMWVFTRFWRSGRLAVAWWMLIMLTRSPSCVIASSHKSRPWATCSSAFFSWGIMPIHNQCFVAKHTFVQKGDYCDMRSSVIVSITWHLVTVRICYYWFHKVQQ